MPASDDKPLPAVGVFWIEEPDYAAVLKILDDGVILKSQAQLAMSLVADWCDGQRAVAGSLLIRLGATLG